jgi:hypothetical protein
MAVTLSKRIPGAISWFSYLTSQKSGWQTIVDRIGATGPWRRRSLVSLCARPFWSTDLDRRRRAFFKIPHGRPPRPGPPLPPAAILRQLNHSIPAHPDAGQSSHRFRFRAIGTVRLHISRATRNPSDLKILNVDQPPSQLICIKAHHKVAHLCEKRWVQSSKPPASQIIFTIATATKDDHFVRRCRVRPTMSVDCRRWF